MSFLTSDSTAKLDVALAKAQGEIESAAKDKTNPAFRSKYADITAVWDACRPALSKHQISLTQWLVHSDDDRVHIITRVAHAGEWMRSEYSLPVSKKDAHGYGSACTYARRFTLAAALGIVADEDDDGNHASQKFMAQPAAPKGYSPRNSPPAVSGEDRGGDFSSENGAHIQAPVSPTLSIPFETKQVLTAMKKFNWTTTQVVEWMTARFNKTKLQELTESEHAKLLQVLEIQNHATAMQTAKMLNTQTEGDAAL